MYNLVVFVPNSHFEIVRKAICDAGAGRTGNYSDCIFYSEGTGTFKPLKGSKPFIGQKGHVSKVREIRIETAVDGKLKSKVIKALKTSHPYETPVYYLTKLA